MTKLVEKPDFPEGYIVTAGVCLIAACAAKLVGASEAAVWLWWLGASSSALALGRFIKLLRWLGVI